MTVNEAIARVDELVHVIIIAIHTAHLTIPHSRSSGTELEKTIQQTPRDRGAITWAVTAVYLFVVGVCQFMISWSGQ